ANDGTYWVAVGAGGTLYYKSGSAPSGAWTSNTQGSSTLLSVANGNDGYWVIAGTTGGLVYYATDPTRSWSSQSVISADFVFWGDGNWVTSGGSPGVLAYATDPSGTWTRNDQGSTYGLYYANSTWVAVGGSGNVRYAQGGGPNIPDSSTINS